MRFGFVVLAMAACAKPSTAPLEAASPQPAPVPLPPPAPCEPGNAARCYELGLASFIGQGAAPDYEQARTYFEIAGAGADADPRAWLYLGTIYRWGYGVEVDGERSKELFDMACLGNVTHACTFLAEQLIYDDEGWDFQRAASLLSYSCEEGHVRGCAYEGLAHLLGLGTAVDYAAAVERFEIACDGSDAAACNNLGEMYLLGLGTERDHKLAAFYYEKSCEGGGPVGCLSLGDMYHYDKLLPSDPERARYYYREACDRESEMACYRLESPESSLSEVAFDEAACEEGLAGACYSAQLIYQVGEGVPVDLGKAALYQQKACALHHTYCEAVLPTESAQ